MKKNLFGAVAAGLALALAITSFGCESGNDDPIARLTDADLANVTGQKFVYVATPTEYQPANTTAETPTGTTGSYEWVSYVDGRNAYNRNTSSSVLTRNASGVKGTDGGDVIKTKKVSLTLNTKDYTWSLLEETTSKEVFDIVDYDAANAGYASVKAVKAKETATIGALTPFAVSAPSGTPGTSYTAAAITPGYLVTTAPGNGYADAKAKIDARITAANALKVTAVYTAEEKAFNDAVDANVKALKEDLLLIDAKWHGATKVVVETSAAAVTTTTYLKADGSNAIAPVTATGTAPKAKTGKYSVTSGNYITGTFLVTADDKVTFDDANDLYVDDGYKGKISITYPEAGATGGRAGVIGNKTSRTFSIANNVLTLTKTNTSYTDSTPKTYGFFKGAGSYTKYYDNSAVGYVATAEEGYKSYSFTRK